MDAHALDVLEFDAIRDRLADATETPCGAELARALVPSSDRREVERAQALTSEVVGLLDESLEPSFAGVEDVRPAVKHAARDGQLALRDLRHVAVAIDVALQAKEALGASRDAAPLLDDLAGPIDPKLTAVSKAIHTCVEDDGSDLRDNASPQLRKLRSEVRRRQQRVSDDLAKLVRRGDLQDFLQETFITERGGRPVLAVRVSARGKVPGIVHDASGSGQTLFVEPLAIVDQNNELAEISSAAREEAERIVRELSARVGEDADAIEALVDAAAAIDLALARGTVSHRWRGASVEISHAVSLIGARHPLLDSSSAVPIDLDLESLRALVLSGPNTGGKTVALKTLGLAALLHQAGLRPPADTAALPVFDLVLADIGDEQSIEMSLSTFSAHVRNLVAILRAATGRSLVLLDELAAGTDPAEGSALAQALLAQLVAQARLTVVATHYPELKEWASATEDVANAATGFDPDTHAPLYTVTLGRPGTSQALRIAERLGLDPELVADARARVAPERLRTAELLAEAETAGREAAEARVAAEANADEAERLAERARERESELQAEIERVRADAARARQAAVDEAERELAEARAELRGLRDEIRAARRSERTRRATPDTTRTAERERDRRLGAAAERSDRAERALRELDAAVEPADPLAAGDAVEAPDLGFRGTIAAIERDEAEVIGIGGQRVRVPLSRLRPDLLAPVREPEEPAAAIVAAPTRAAVTELDVRGFRAQEAREAVRSFVDDASLAGVPSVLVIHGRGTGAVRAAVREELAHHQLVERQESQSADGATVAHLV